jgi:hypothetical protein
MSHYIDILTEITDREALVHALERMGFKGKIEIHETASALYGYQGDERKQKAHVIIRRSFVGHSSNDIGFEKMSDGRFKAHISEYESATGQYARGSGKYGQEWQNKLYTYYGVEKSKSEFDKKKLKYVEDVDEKQRPRLRVFI